MFCLRRALRWLRFFVGGLQQFSAQLFDCLGDFITAAHANKVIVPQDCIGVANQRAAFIAAKFLHVHFASLLDRSSKRNGRFVLACAGGNA